MARTNISLAIFVAQSWEPCGGGGGAPADFVQCSIFSSRKFRRDFCGMASPGRHCRLCNTLHISLVVLYSKYTGLGKNDFIAPA